MHLVKQNASENEINTALHTSACHDLITQLLQRLHTQVGAQSSLLSGGQRQRLALACFFSSNRRFLSWMTPLPHWMTGSMQKLLRFI